MIDISELMYRLKTLPLIPRIILFSVAGLLVLGLLLWSFSDVLFPASPSAHTTTTVKARATATAVSVPVSPLIFGTNLGLQNAQDPVLTSASTQSGLQQIHTQIIRMPVRLSISEATEIQAAQTIKNLGLVPVITLLQGTDANALSYDARIVKDMNTVFGSNTVYYEYGNEEDLLGTSAASYTASWNAAIPQLKQLAPQAHFVGPVTYHYDHAYLSSFLTGAQPRPDEISWHEYTCAASDTEDACLTNINNWTTHIADARTTATGVVGKALPLMITEWNYAPDAVSSANTTDAKSKDNAFLMTWTQRALQTLATNHVFASMQYYCTSSVPLVASDNSIAAQGLAFKAQYEHLVVQPTNSTVALQGTPTATAADGTTATATVSSSTTDAGSQATPTTSTLPVSTPGSQSLPTATTPPVVSSTQPTATATSAIQPTATPTTGIQPTATDTTTIQPTATSTPTTVDPQTLYTTVTGVAPAYTTSLASQDGGKWDTGPFSRGGGCSFAGGGYQIAVPQKGFAGVCVANGTYISNFAYQVQMTIVSGDGGGLVFRDANQQMYRLRIGSDGTYDLVNQSQVLAAGPSTAIKSGLNQANALTVIAKNQQIYIYVNGQFLTSVTDTASSGGKLGFFAVDFTNSTTVTFSNAQVWTL